MNTPICDFVKKYAESDSLRLHMPGHKGKSLLGFESFDITEIDGADSLYEAEGIIKESEKNASLLFDSPTFYSVEGSSQCIKAMLYLVCQKAEGKALIWAGRNVHKSFLSAAVLLDFETEWLYPEYDFSYLSCRIDAEYLEKELNKAEKKPDAIYVTSPDYTGNISDIRALAEVCHRHGVMLLVDNAHGAYLKFLENSLFPIDLGADMCASSAHKTLPVLTGGAYLHISEKLSHISESDVKTALSLFGSTSPSYLILQSLDMANKIISDDFKDKLFSFEIEMKKFKSEITEQGYTLVEDEVLKITIDAKKYGYYGYELADILKENNMSCEFADPDFLVLMLAPDSDLKKLWEVLLKIKKKEEISLLSPCISKPRRIYSPREASFMQRETVPISESLGRILAVSTVGCPPAVPIVAGGEEIDKNAIRCFEYYNIKNCTVIK
ncbi:MAG: aminotransferase class I/II-fold pyridoxal phosphate-dependent enzyme [Clostridia bacterium]|nr:aminotransferase class I/II-fold pyridoxal phosphate-dependent enzyme [Clostridia bacterium]